MSQFYRVGRCRGCGGAILRAVLTRRRAANMRPPRSSAYARSLVDEDLAEGRPTRRKGRAREL